VTQQTPPAWNRPTIASEQLSVWVVTDGAAGNERQASALADAMHLTSTKLRAHLRPPWSWLAPRVTTGARHALPAAIRNQIAPPWPALAIGCGRQAALLTRMLREYSGGKIFTVQILDPRIDPKHFDLVIAPHHDQLAGSNVISCLGALNPVDDAWLAHAAAEFSTLQQLPQPRTALLVGGPHRELALDTEWLDGLVARLQHLLARDRGSLMIALSRRTPPAWATRLRDTFRAGCVHFWGSAHDGTNPYAGYLAHADRIVVTPDSVNMLSEACASGKPVFSYLPQAARGKLAAFHAALRVQSRLCELGDAAISTLLPIPPLRETAAVADKVWRHYRARQSSPNPDPGR